MILVAAIVAKALGADGFDAYPTVELEMEPATFAFSALIALAGLAPWRRHA